jgi:pyruvate formate lyase activating enzyme
MQCSVCNTFECVKVWRHPAFELAGTELSVSSILQKADEIKAVADGITFGGGEPTMQADELFTILDALRQKGVHTAVESNASTTRYNELAGRTDYLISDLKAGSAENYMRLTGCDGKLVQQNLLYAAEIQKELLIRIPLIPGFNTTDAEMQLMRDFLIRMLNKREKLCVQTLRLHHAGSVKYKALQMPYALEGVEPPPEELQDKFQRMLAAAGLTILDFNNKEIKYA